MKRMSDQYEIVIDKCCSWDELCLTIDLLNKLISAVREKGNADGYAICTDDQPDTNWKTVISALMQIRVKLQGKGRTGCMSAVESCRYTIENCHSELYIQPGHAFKEWVMYDEAFIGGNC